MQFLLNHLSLHGQFSTPGQFCDSVGTIMRIRNLIKRHGLELFCDNKIISANAVGDQTMQAVVKYLPQNDRRALMQWLTTAGPFWINERQHSDIDWLETRSETLVTDTAVGEAAYCKLNGLNRELVSITPSNWVHDPISVTLRKDDITGDSIDVRNHVEESSVLDSLGAVQHLPNTWDELDRYARECFVKLTFVASAFEPLSGHPFSLGAAERILSRLNVLDRLCQCYDGSARTPEGNLLFSEHFTGDKAWFSDSSDSEKSHFKSELMFPHPDINGTYLFCTWHGKIKSPQIRIHFSWPIAPDKPLYIVYVGPKITKR